MLLRAYSEFSQLFLEYVLMKFFFFFLIFIFKKWEKKNLMAMLVHMSLLHF